MKTNQNFGIAYILLAIIQIVICNYFNFSAYVTISILPVLLLCMPLKIKAITAMVIAFATGLAVDFLGDGLPGLNAAALVPVALVRKALLQTIVGKELMEGREEPLSLKNDGFGKVSLSIILATGLFLAIYISADGAGTRPVSFNIAKFAASLFCSYLLSLVVTHVLNDGNR